MCTRVSSKQKRSETSIRRHMGVHLALGPPLWGCDGVFHPVPGLREYSQGSHSLHPGLTSGRPYRGFPGRVAIFQGLAPLATRRCPYRGNSFLRPRIGRGPWSVAEDDQGQRDAAAQPSIASLTGWTKWGDLPLLVRSWAFLSASLRSLNSNKATRRSD